MNYANGLIRYIEASPSSYHAVRTALEAIKNKDNYSAGADIRPGICCSFTKETKDGAALVAVDIGENAAAHGWPVHMIAAHVDSPWFLIEGDKFIRSENTLQIPIRPCGGMLQSTWMDRPLALAGRVDIRKPEDVPETRRVNRAEVKPVLHKLVYLKDSTFIIPNMCSHFKKYIEDDIPVHLLYAGTKSGFAAAPADSLRQLLSNELNVSPADIEGWSLNTVCREKACIWGPGKEFISSARLDDLACVYTALTAFTKSHNPNAVNVLYLCDNEETGSKTSVGACGSFLKHTLRGVSMQLGFGLAKAMKNSFMISADNAQACHPDHPYIYNPDHKIYMNMGLAAKVSERYSTTEESLALFDKLCAAAGQPHQLYYNRDDIRGGGTIGKIVQDKLCIMSVDVGIPQLAMHSCYETLGTQDIKTTAAIFTYFYKSYGRAL